VAQSHKQTYHPRLTDALRDLVSIHDAALHEVVVGVPEDLADFIASRALGVLFFSMGNDVPAKMHIARLR
jgi:hypothetical protein